jgi:N-acetyl-anhydromuramyl-L-alanine amidase AmpD
VTDAFNEDTRPLGVPPVIAAAPRLPFVKFTQSPHCNQVKRARTQFLVIHATDGHENDGIDDGVNAEAEAVAAMFARADLKPRRSAQYVIDSDSIVQCVKDEHRAWAACHHGNDLGIHIELCGFVKQKRADWFDASSLPQLQLAARLVATLCGRFSLPRQFLSAKDLLAGKCGVTDHYEITEAWHESDHTDPGNGFPWPEFIRAVQLAGP